MAGGLIPEPYSYPKKPHLRRHGPRDWKDYRRYRAWLRDEFSFRCVYCLEREAWRDMRERMHIEHFEPQAIRRDLKAEYNNLLYACPACNSEKGDTILCDPCKVALGDCLQVHQDGRIEAKNNSPEGQALIAELALDDPLTIARRRLIIGALRTFAEHNWPAFVEWMGYPEDLPNLNSKENKSIHNDRPEGVAESFYEKKQRGELPEVY